MGIYAGWAAHEGSSAAEMSRATRDGVVTFVAGDCVADTNLPAMYSEFEDRFVERLNGTFSGLLIDTRRRRVLLFNDRYGFDRLYIHETPDAIYFASEAKALLRVLPSLRRFDDRGVAQWLAFGCTLGTQTLFRGISVLPGGTLWRVAEGAPAQYFTPEVWESQPALTPAEFDAALQDTFARVLPRYTSGTSFGISLTGGLDTRMIAACLPDGLDCQPVCYTFSGSTQTSDERLAASVARTCRLEHHVLRIDDRFIADYAACVDHTVHATDGVFGATGAHEIYLNGKARRLSPVRLTGNFGSEVFRSMSTFKPLGLAQALLRPETTAAIAEAIAEPPQDAVHPVTFAAFREIPWKLYGSFAAARSQLTTRTPYMDNELVALAFRAPAESRRSADPALRLVARARPALAAIPTDRGLLADERGLTRLGRRALAEITFKLDYLHKQGMPASLTRLEPAFDVLARAGVLGRHQYLPYRIWFRRQLAGHVMDVLTDASTSRLPYFDSASLTSIADNHVAGRGNFVGEIDAVLTLEAIDRLLIRGADRSDTVRSQRPL